MITTRPYYNNSDEFEFCRRSGRGMQLQSLREDSSRYVSNYDSLEVTSSRMSPSSDADGKIGGQQRRRIAVACGRCRKRKIKCSGDPGNGTGCSNCKNSGTTQCQFLRVNSEECVPLSRASCWPYGTAPATVPPTTLAQGYGGAGYQGSIRSSQASLISAPTHYASRQSSYPYYLGSPHSVARAGYSSYEEDGQYVSQPSAYTETLQFPGLFGSVGSPKPWTSQETASYPTPVYNSYTPTPLSTLSSTATGMPSLFPVMSSASTHITNGRTLPDPTAAVRNHSINGLATSVPLTEYLPSSSSSSGYKSSAHWATESVSSGSSAGSSRTLSIGTVSSGPATSSKASSTSQDMGFGYIPISHSPTAAPMTSTAAYISTDAVDSSPNPYCTSGISSTDSRDTMISPKLSGDYSHTRNLNGKRWAVGEPTLTNGEKYQRLPPTHDPTYSETYHASDLAELPMHPAARTSISEVSSGGNY